jgi:Ca2+-transporting ATPase
MFTVRSAKETLTILKSRETGLTAHEVQARRAQYGPNALTARERRDTLGKVIVRQFSSILILILLVAGGVSFFLGDAVDGQVILLTVLINVVVGAYQEKKASQALASLKKAVVTTARVWRGGALIEIRQEDLVPGDIVELQAGDRVPADIRLIAAHDLETNEAPLTGESHPQAKTTRVIETLSPLAERVNMLFLGTTVAAGRGKGVVVATGTHTEMGTIAQLLAETQEVRTPLQHQLDQFARHLLILVIAVVALMFFIGVSRGRSLAEMFATSIAVAVSAIPEGLTIALTVILALGMQAILKKKGLVRSLLAAETLGATSVICTDKTGTLTRGEMEVVTLETERGSYGMQTLTAGNTPPELSELFNAAARCNDAAVPGQEGKVASIGNTTDRALMGLLIHTGIDVAAARRTSPRVDETPFSSATKYMATLHRGTPPLLYVKGAPEAILPYLTQVKTPAGTKLIDAKMRETLLQRAEGLSRKGLRVLCLSERLVEDNVKKIGEALTNLTFLGFVGIQDPLRSDAAEAIAAAGHAGIATVMITGDHRLTATAIAQDLGLLVKGKEVMDGTELRTLKPQELAARVRNVAVYSRATPEDKLRIIEAWRRRGAVVAMTRRR